MLKYLKYHHIFHILCVNVSIYLVLLNISTAKVFDPLIQLPSYGLYRNTSGIGKIILLNVNDFGAKGDGITDDTETLQDVWKIACNSSSRAKILIPEGNSYLIHPIDFPGPCQSKVTLKIRGVLVAPQDPDVWSGFDVRKWLYFHGVNHLTVEGGGKIDGMGKQWWAQSCKRNISNPCTHAPTALTFHKCNNLKLRDITSVNSQQMHVAFTSCENVSVSALKVIAPADSPNTDGIHISASKHVVLNRIVVHTGDDCVSIVSNSSNIRIKDIICGAGHGVSIGSLGKYNSTSSVQNVVVDRAFFMNTENGVRIKTWQGGCGFARKIKFQNIWMLHVWNPIIIDQYYCDSRLPCLNQTSAVSIDNISFRGIKGTSATEEAIKFSCSDSYPCKRLYLEDIQLEWVYGISKSFCWEAYGKTSGLIIPPPCVSSGESIIQPQVKSNSTGWLKDEYAFYIKHI